MDSLAPLLARIAEAARLRELAHSTWRAAVFLLLVFLVIYLIEGRTGADKSRYLTKNFRNDVLYGLFYQGGAYQMFIGAAIANMLGPRLDVFRIGVLAALPLPAMAVTYWLTTDFLQYWVHRMQHRIPFLWAFHSVHHANERLSFISTYRIHPLDSVLGTTIMFVPLLVIGAPTRTWMPLFVVQYGLEMLQHAELDWSFGRAYRWIVSPRFHRLHHSAEHVHHDRNFSKVLSLWDFLFGTAVAPGTRADRFGVDGMAIGESIGAQLAAPFHTLRGQLAGRRPVPAGADEHRA